MIDAESNLENLLVVFSSTTNPLVMRAFLQDVMTPKELQEISSRLQAAVMLEEGKKYTAIIDSTGLSSRTIARISDWMKKDSGGYAAAIATIKSHHKHM
ncbi:MAG: YerC/YecD family TrpR-related protein [Candidatus Saccharimonadaceae bacterium]